MNPFGILVSDKGISGRKWHSAGTRMEKVTGTPGCLAGNFIGVDFMHNIQKQFVNFGTVLAVLVICILGFGNNSHAALLSSSYSIKASYDFTGNPTTGPFTAFDWIFSIGNDGWDSGTSVDVGLYDSSNTLLWQDTFFNPLSTLANTNFGNSNISLTTATNDPVGYFLLTSIDAQFDVLAVGITLDKAGGSTGNQYTALEQVASVSAVPLPPSAILFGTALLGIAGLRRRKRKASPQGDLMA